MRSPVSLLSLVLLAACAGPVDTEGTELEALDATSSTAKNTKQDVCHVTGNGSYHVINVSSSAVSAHLAHGDHLAGTYYYDADGDGQGDDAITSQCLDPDYVEVGGDCDDDDDTVYSGAEEVCGDELDNDCDGDVDEECTVQVEIHVNADNGVWGWVDGEAVEFDYTEPNWFTARSATLELDAGTDHAFAFYVEDWGGLAYFAASIRVDGQVVAASGSGDFVSTGGWSASSVNEWPRIAAWADVPESSSDWPNLIFDPGTTWGDWMLLGFDDSSWSADTNTCTYPTNWNTTSMYGSYPTFADLYDDGAEFVWHNFGVYAAGYCYSVGDSGTAWRAEISL